MRFATPNKEETFNFFFYSVLHFGLFMVIEYLTVCI